MYYFCNFVSLLCVFGIQMLGGQAQRLVLFGDVKVGKTALTIQFVLGKFVKEYNPTIEDTYSKEYVVDNKPAKLNITDTSGRSEYSVLREQYMRTGEGFLLVFSVTDHESFEEIHEIHSDILRVKGRNRFPMLLVGNKVDLGHRVVSFNDAQTLARRLNMPYMECSAKTPKNVDQAFSALIRLVRRFRATGSVDPEPVNNNTESKGTR